MTMQSFIPALAGLLSMLALAPGTARAEVVGTITVGPGLVQGGFDAPDTQTWAVTLQRGRVYALSGTALSHEREELHAAGGGLVAAADISDGNETQGVTFVAPYSGDYAVTVTISPEEFSKELGTQYDIAVTPDCPAADTTRCRIAVGQTHHNLQGSFDGDGDWFSASLAAGHRYEAVVSAVDPDWQGDQRITVIDPRGRIVTSDGWAGSLSFVAATNGTYTIVVVTDFGPVGYDLTLRAAR